MRHANKVLAAVAIPVIVMILYGGVYLANMQRARRWMLSERGQPIGESMYARYRVGGRFAEYFFAPAHQADVLLRPELWADDMY